jgi:hypothetical protein
MRTIAVTDHDRRSGGLAPERLAAALAALAEDGFVVLAGAVDPAHVAVLRDRLLADAAAITARADAPYNWNRGNLQQSAPREPAFLFADVVANDQVVAVTAAVLGEAVTNAFYSGNTALPGIGERQPVHSDGGHLWPAAAGWAPPHTLGVNLPLVDMDEGNGAIELWPGSHRDVVVVHGGSIEVPAEAIARRRRVAPPFQPAVPAGSLLIRDMRLWHAGMPNRGAAPRPMLAMIHSVGWWPHQDELVFPRAAEPLLRHPRALRRRRRRPHPPRPRPRLPGAGLTAHQAITVVSAAPSAVPGRRYWAWSAPERAVARVNGSQPSANSATP